MSKQENDLSKELSFGLSSKKTFSNEQQTSLIGNTIINTNISDDGTLSTIYFYSNNTILYCMSSNTNNDNKVLSSIDLSKEIIKISISYDNRIVIVCTIDGILHCYNVLNNGLELDYRWSNNSSSTIINTPIVVVPVIVFAPFGYNVLIIDNKTCKAIIIDASSSTQEDILNSVTNYTYGCWCPVSNTSSCMTVALSEAISGIIRILSIESMNNNNVVNEISSISPPKLLAFLPSIKVTKVTNVWRCNHLLWYDKGHYLLCGYCRITPKYDHDDDDEEEDENDHETLMFIAVLDKPPKCQLKYYIELNDVCPYFYMPKGGRYVYYSCYIPTINILLVGCNVSNEITTLGKTKKKEYEILNIDTELGNGIITPLDENDNFSNVIGLGCIVAPNGERLIVLGSTDNTISLFKIDHKSQSKKYAQVTNFTSHDNIPNSETPVLVPSQIQPIVKTTDNVMKEKANEPESTISPSSFDVTQSFSPSKKKIEGKNTLFTFGNTQTQTTTTTAPLFGQTSTTPTHKSIFGTTASATKSPLSFGQTSALLSSLPSLSEQQEPKEQKNDDHQNQIITPTKPIFGSTTNITNAPIFGQTSSLFTSPTNDNNNTAAKPIFGQTSTVFGAPSSMQGQNTIFGSPAMQQQPITTTTTSSNIFGSSSSSNTGFAALASTSESGGFASLANKASTSTPGFGAFAATATNTPTPTLTAGFGALAVTTNTTPIPTFSTPTKTSTPSSIFGKNVTSPLGIERSPFITTRIKKIEQQDDDDNESNSSSSSSSSSASKHPSDINSYSNADSSNNDDDDVEPLQQLDNLQFCSNNSTPTPVKNKDDKQQILSAQKENTISKLSAIFDMHDNTKTGVIEIKNIDLILNEIKELSKYNNDLVLNLKVYLNDQTYDEGMITKEIFLDLCNDLMNTQDDHIDESYNEDDDSSYEQPLDEEEEDDENEKEDIKKAAEQAFDQFSIKKDIIMLLSMRDDKKRLIPSHCFIRKHLCFFNATITDVVGRRGESTSRF